MNYVKAIGVVMTLCLFNGCQSEQPAVPPARPEGAAGQRSLPWKGDGFGLTVTDANADGGPDILAMSHAEGGLQSFLQAADRKNFRAIPGFDGVGFHPGNLIEWPAASRLWVEAAEGSGKIRAFAWNESDQAWRGVSERDEFAPRYVSRFEWPHWGPSLAVAPYVNGYVILLQGYDPATGQAGERQGVPLSSKPSTIRAAERLTVADLEGDGVPELLFAVSATNEVMVIRYPGTPEDGPVRPLRAEVLYRDDQWGMPNEVQVQDLDGNGVPEIIVPDEAKPSRIHVLARQDNALYKEVDAWAFPGQDGVMEFRMMTDHDGRRYGLAAGPGAVAIYQLPLHWTFGEAVPVRHIGWHRPGDFPQDMQLADLDGDGWQDLVLGRSISEYNVWLAYGPLWDRFKALAEMGFSLE